MNIRKNKKFVYLFILFLFGTMFSVLAQKKEWFALNLDWMHFYQSRTEAHMNMAHVEAYIDQYATGGKVTHLFFNVNAQRASFRSATRESVWDLVPGMSEEELHKIWRESTVYPGAGPLVAKALYDNGIDPYAVWIQRSREKGISPWLSVRMNDVHYAEDRMHFFHSEFWRSNPHLWRVPNSTGVDWNGYAFDYAHQAVREYQLSFIQELLERYDPDGIELDWNRNPYHLRNGRYSLDAHYIDEFVSQVRSLTQEWAVERGRDIGLCVRVPSYPDAAESLGLNAALWAREGWVDVIVPAPYYSTTDYNIRLDIWRERLGNSAGNVRLLPCSEARTCAFWPAEPAFYTQRLSFLYAFVDIARFREADGIYLFNWFDGGPNSNTIYRQLLLEGIDDEYIMSRERRYPVTYRDIAPAGVSNDMQLPRELNAEQSIRIMMGAIPENASVELILGFENRAGLDRATFSASLNGINLGNYEEDEELARLGSEPGRAVKFICPLQALQSGENEMKLLQTTGARQNLVWVELRVRRSFSENPGGTTSVYIPEAETFKINCYYAGNDLLNISILSGSDLETVTVSCFDISGKKLFQHRKTISSASDTPINMSLMPPGMYLVQIETPKGVQAFKIVKTN